MANIHDVGSPVSFIPYSTNSGIFTPIEKGEPVRLCKAQSALLIEYLKESHWGNLISRDFELQSLAQLADGTQLLTAIAPPSGVIAMLRDAGHEFEHVASRIQHWIDRADCSGVFIDFFDNRKCNF